MVFFLHWDRPLRDVTVGGYDVIRLFIAWYDAYSPLFYVWGIEGMNFSRNLTTTEGIIAGLKLLISDNL